MALGPDPTQHLNNPAMRISSIGSEQPAKQAAADPQKPPHPHKPAIATKTAQPAVGGKPSSSNTLAKGAPPPKLGGPAMPSSTPAGTAPAVAQAGIGKIIHTSAKTGEGGYHHEVKMVTPQGLVTLSETKEAPPPAPNGAKPTNLAYPAPDTRIPTARAGAPGVRPSTQVGGMRMAHAAAAPAPGKAPSVPAPGKAAPAATTLGTAGHAPGVARGQVTVLKSSGPGFPGMMS